jgi:hypothetical protein
MEHGGVAYVKIISEFMKIFIPIIFFLALATVYLDITQCFLQNTTL